MAKRFTKEEFIIKAREIHGEKYDYSQIDYSGFREKVKIVCVDHGSFEQTPNIHLRGSGCRSCGFASKNVKQSLSNSDFIARSQEIHRGKYDYSQTEYQSKRVKVTIICPEHGLFSQLPSNHLAGRGCFKCHRESANNHKLDTEGFIRRARLVHGDTYDYASSVYFHSQQKITITCEDHGAFEITPAVHLQGKGCPTCTKAKRRAPLRLDLAEFIRRSNERHGNRYSYDQVNFTSTQEPVAIICPEHGLFYQKPKAHYDGNGCPRCGRQRKRLSSIYQTEFVEQARAIHGDRYDYSRTVFKSKRNASRVTIICSEHGPFEQNPMNHLRGTGCRACAGNESYSKETYIAAAQGVHGQKYRYDEINYRSNSIHITITCPDHGPFTMIPSIHLAGQGCRKCADKRRSETASSNTEEFVAQAKEVHGLVYDYSNAYYINNNTKVEITCQEHGPFYQIPRSHLMGVGCSRCASSKGETLIRNVLTAQKIDFIEQATFPDLILPSTGGRLRFDFYIPEKAAAVEFDGLQHFEPVDFSGGKRTQQELLDTFAHTQRKDRFKEEYCNAKSIRLLRIPYTEIELVEELILELIQSDSAGY
jgi:hypothetical protein